MIAIALSLLLPSSPALAKVGEPGLRIEEDLFPTAGPRKNSRGDLWPSCWSEDDNLYAANGDGEGFQYRPPGIGQYLPKPVLYDIAVNRIEGRPGRLHGVFLAGGDAVATVHHGYTRKPTGMLCVDGALYMAAQDLSPTETPTANISVSHDKGRTWHWDRRRPMFRDRSFTTIFFLDFGKDSRNSIDGYVYAYGLDNFWARRSRLFLARVPRKRVMDRGAWTFFAGLDGDGKPRFVADIRRKAPVLHDARVVRIGGRASSPISQGSVVYLPALKRYLYSSWTEFTHEFYTAPRPWGPWTHVHQTVFGPYPWSRQRAGGYATTIPSKFISPDGRSMWLQSNCFGEEHGCKQYFFSLRRLRLTDG